jgi:hypothetical protein
MKMTFNDEGFKEVLNKQLYIVERAAVLAQVRLEALQEMQNYCSNGDFNEIISAGLQVITRRRASYILRDKEYKHQQNDQVKN